MEEQNKNVVLTMEYEDGTSGKRELLSIFKADNGLDYAALLPLNDDDTPQGGASVEMVRVKSYKDESAEDFLIEGITTEEELRAAAESFTRLAEFTAEEEEADEANLEILPTLSFKNGNGQFEDWKVVDVFTNNKRDYIALIPLSEAKDSNISIHLMRLTLTVQGGIEGCEVTDIPSDMEYEAVAAAFELRVGA